MLRITVTDLKDKLSKYLRLVKRGEVIEIMERKVPVARVERVEPANADGEAWLDHLAAEGLLIPPKRKLSKSFFKSPPVKCKADLTAIIRDDRDRR